jgi:hypothetical protein
MLAFLHNQIEYLFVKKNETSAAAALAAGEADFNIFAYFYSLFFVLN